MKTTKNITLSPCTYIFMTYLREMVNQKVSNILKTKIDKNFNRYRIDTKYLPHEFSRKLCFTLN